MKRPERSIWVATTVALVALAIFAIWLWPRTDSSLRSRVPGTDAAPSGESGGANPVLVGKLIPGDGQPAHVSGSWPQFRGPNRDGRTAEPAKFSRDWKSAPPHELWSLDVGEGYAGAIVRDGRVYLLDYDRDAKQSCLRCLSLDEGKELWRFAYPLNIKRNHGMTRTVPVVTDKYVVALDSKCNLFTLDAANGQLQWSSSLVHDFGATIPEWYTGQCPLVDGDKVILAPGGKSALLVALDLATGKPLWQTPNPQEWKMTHSSIMPMDFGNRRLYLYCANKGVVGVDAKDGALVWASSDWKIGIATVPSPLPLPNGKVFFTGGYGVGSLMVQFEDKEGKLTAKRLFKLEPEVFGATQHTPIFKDGYLYGARADGRFVCLDLDGKVVWASGPGETFGLGSFLIAGDLVLALNDSGKLRLFDASPAKFNILGEAQPLTNRESWAPMALVGNRLLLRDLTRFVCLELPAK